MANTLRFCESLPIEGETKFCATSLESLFDLVRHFFGISNSETGCDYSRGLSLLTSNFIDGPRGASFRNFTILEPPEEVELSRMMGCHIMLYPYPVFYCHSQGGRHRVFKVLLGGENGDKVAAVAACHGTISRWDPRACRVPQGFEPDNPICHFFPPHGNLAWVYYHDNNTSTP